MEVENVCFELGLEETGICQPGRCWRYSVEGVIERKVLLPWK
jgi:hypothetical protein